MASCIADTKDWLNEMLRTNLFVPEINILYRVVPQFECSNSPALYAALEEGREPPVVEPTLFIGEEANELGAILNHKYLFQTTLISLIADREFRYERCDEINLGIYNGLGYKRLSCDGPSGCCNSGCNSRTYYYYFYDIPVINEIEVNQGLYEIPWEPRSSYGSIEYGAELIKRLKLNKKMSVWDQRLTVVKIKSDVKCANSPKEDDYRYLSPMYSRKERKAAKVAAQKVIDGLEIEINSIKSSNLEDEFNAILLDKTNDQSCHQFRRFEMGLVTAARRIDDLGYFLSSKEEALLEEKSEKDNQKTEEEDCIIPRNKSRYIRSYKYIHYVQGGYDYYVVLFYHTKSGWE